MRARTRLFMFGFLLGAGTWCGAALAEITYSEVLEDASSTVIRMKVTPAAEPAPVFKYRFVAPDIDLKPGNAAPFYYRVLMDLGRRMEAFRKRYGGEEERWYAGSVESLSIDQLPLEKIRDAVEMALGGAVGQQLAEASRRRDCDFELGVSEIRGVDLVHLPLEEFQRSREIGRMLALRTRLEIAERRYGDAIDTMRMNYQLARNFSSEPFFVPGLIGIAESAITNTTVLELIAAPESPNLYWALSELPQPLVDMRAAARFEIDFGTRMFPFIHRAETTNRSPDEWNRLFVQSFSDLQKVGGDLSLFGGGNALEPRVASGFLATAAGLLGYPHAKTQLIAAEMDPERVEKMAVGQVLAIYTERNYQRFANDWEKLWYMPFWEMRRYTRTMEKQIVDAKLAGGGLDREVLPLVSLLLPAMEAARTAQVRLERDMAALRVVESLRMHAAAHGGKLPQVLADIELVPVPLNPATGKPFAYRLDGATAILDLPPSDGIPVNRRFEIQFVKNGE